MKRNQTHKQDGAFYTRATVDSATIVDTAEEKSFEVVFATESPVFRRGWEENFNEILSLKKSNMRLGRLEALAVPLLDNHDRWTGVRGQYGRADTFQIVEGKEGRAKIIYSTQDDKAQIWKDIKAGIIRSISCGYNVYKYIREVVSDNSIPNYTAVDWEPTEISLAPVPADFKSAVRSTEAAESHIIIIEDFSNVQNTRSDMEKNTTVVENDTTTTEQNRSSGNTHTTTVAVDEKKVRNEGVQAERQRVIDIQTAAKNAGLDEAFANDLITRGVDINEARAEIINKIAEKNAGPNVRSASVAPAVTGTDEAEQVRSAMQSVILHRVEPGSVKLEGKAQDFKGMKLLDMARHMLQAKGENPFRFSQNELVHRAIATTDYPDLLTSTVGRQLRRYFNAQVGSWQQLAQRTSVSDFRAKTGVQVDGAITFDKIAEGGEYKSAKILQNSKATISVETYGKLVSITRHAIINDDLDVFSRVPIIFALGAKNLQAKMFWDLITGNAKTPDGKAIFHADHSNLAAAGATLSEETLNAAIVAMMKQQSAAGEELGLTPKYLIVPVELQTAAKKILSSITAAKTGDVNVFQGAFEPLSEVRLSRNSATAWYMAADPSTVEGLMYAYLDGEEGLYTESHVNFNNDAVETKARMEFGVAAWEHRGWYKNPGA